MNSASERPKEESEHEKIFSAADVSELLSFRLAHYQKEVRILRREVALARSSLVWRVTKPLRWIKRIYSGNLPTGWTWSDVIALWRELRREWGTTGATILLAKKAILLAKRLYLSELVPVADTKIYLADVATPAVAFKMQILIIADLDIAQCTRYRVTQKKAHLEAAGWDVEIADWRDPVTAMSKMQVATQVIFYRVPFGHDVRSLVAEAMRLNLAPRWEVDDLIFSHKYYASNANLMSLTPEERVALLSDADRFLQCLQACGRGIASTHRLAEVMREYGIDDVYVIENALDHANLTIAEAARKSTTSSPSPNVWICYGSGSRAHDADFRVAEQAIFSAMQEDERLCLRVIGPVALSEDFAQFKARVERIAETSARDYLELLAASDIAIAPLEESVFNACKSVIKYTEASLLELPSVCSNLSQFSAIIEDGKNGYLAATLVEWQQKLLSLTRDPELRRRMGVQARDNAYARFASEKIVQSQILPAFGHGKTSVKRKPRILMVNVYFAPISFGGATLVVEGLIDEVRERGYDVSVFTTRPSFDARPDGAMRYQARGVDVISVVPGYFSRVENFQIDREFRRWLERWEVDLVHFHAIQELGAGLAQQCLDMGIPYVVTLHDCWWLSDALFIGRDLGQYAYHQKQHPVIALPSEENIYLQARRRVTYKALMQASALLTPSNEHRQVYERNGIPAGKIRLNRNGFRWPTRPRVKRRPASRVRFGYVGGKVRVKGYDLLKHAFSLIEESDWELLLVDNTLNLGFTSSMAELWQVKGSIRVVPAYSQEDIDAFFDQIDVLLFPSQWPESYGLTVREALSRDVWVLSTRPGGQAEEIIDGENGDLMAMGEDPEPWAQRITSLLRDPNKFDYYANPYKNRLSNYTCQAAELTDIYAELLDEP